MGLKGTCREDLLGKKIFRVKFTWKGRIRWAITLEWIPRRDGEDGRNPNLDQNANDIIDMIYFLTALG
jgi:hypothetical protein